MFPLIKSLEEALLYITLYSVQVTVVVKGKPYCTSHTTLYKSQLLYRGSRNEHVTVHFTHVVQSPEHCVYSTELDYNWTVRQGIYSGLSI